VTAGTPFMRSALVVSAGTVLSRSLGLVREILMAWFFGTSMAKSAFDVAFRIPNLFRRLFGEGALSAAFIPVFTETLERNGHGAANRLAGRILALLAVTLAMIVGGGVLAAGTARIWIEPGARAAAVLPLLQIMLPYMFFICLTAFFMALLNSMGHFAVPALTPVLLNLVWIAALLILCPRFGPDPGRRIYGVAWGILAAGILQLAVQAPVVLGFGFRPRLSLDWQDPTVRRVVALMGPAALGMGVVQVNALVDSVLALTVAGWAPAALTYAERLIYLPLGVIGTAMGTVLLPTFARQAARRRPDDIRATLGAALRNLLLVMTPAAVGLGVLARPIVELLFVWKGGQFDPRSTMLTGRAVVFYAPGLLLFSVQKILVPAFYALQDMRTPVRIAIRVVGLNLVLNILFVLTWPFEFKHAGLACATVLASAANGLALARVLHRRVGSPGWRRVLGTAARVAAASAVMGAAAWLVNGRVSAAVARTALSPKVGQLAAVAASVGAGIVVYLALGAAICRREWREWLETRRPRDTVRS